MATYNPFAPGTEVQQASLYDVLSSNPTMFTPMGATFDLETGWSGTTSPTAEYAKSIGKLDALYAGQLPGVMGGTDPAYRKWLTTQMAGSDPQKYFDEKNLNNLFRYNPATGMGEYMTGGTMGEYASDSDDNWSGGY